MNNGFKRFVFSACFALAICLVTTSAFGATLHVMIVSDTESNIADSCQNDLKNVRRMMRKASNYTGMSLNEKVFAYAETSASDVLAYIANLEVDSDDVLFFYYSGHGYRFSNKVSDWPMLCLNDCLTGEGSGLDFNDILVAMEEKNTRLKLAFADCCNSFIDVRGFKTRQSFSWGVDHEVMKEGYRKLFLESSGFIAGRGCDVGEYSYCTYEGGFFTLSMIESLENLIQQGNPGWESVIQQVESTVPHKWDVDQHPVFHYVPGEAA